MDLLAIDRTDLIILEGGSVRNFAGKNLGDIINTVLPYAYSLAGIILLLLLIAGGLGLMTSAGDPKKVESAQKRITNAIIGIVIIFASYWIIQLLSTLLGIERLNIFK